MSKSTVLVTGGLGFIGSHTVVELLESGFDVIILDNLSNSKENVADKIQLIANKPVTYIIGDVANIAILKTIFIQYKIDFVIHFAGLKSVSESVKEPLFYYDHNIGITLNLINMMKKYSCKKLIFSSSATVYGSQEAPVNENMIVGQGITNPYGRTKYFIEEILKDLSISDPEWTIVLLRYFNPVGAHPYGLLGENPNGVPNNLMPYVLRVAGAVYPVLNVYGSDYDTEDGTAVRDFIHVVDLAKGHISSIKALEKSGVHTYNLGTGKGSSVKQVIDTFVSTNDINVPYMYTSRRSGDLAKSFASVSKAKEELGWVAELSLIDICRDAWKAYKMSEK